MTLRTAPLMLAALMTIALAGAAHAATMSKAEFSNAKSRISADYSADKTACKSSVDNAKSVCMAQAKAKEKVARAELEYNYSGKASDQTKLQKVKADTAYDVSKQQCSDKSGNDKDVCIQTAKTVRTKAQADAKMGQKMDDAAMQSSDAKRDAEYKLAKEKCDAMTGDTKTACLRDANTKYGKS